MPPWPDLTLYHQAAHNVLQGGVHYRDVFDTNLPGFVWLMCLIHATLGESTLAARALDLVVVACVCGVFWAWLKHLGCSPIQRAWFVVGVALFYLHTTEYCHVQRDLWMLLPASLAAWLQVKTRQANVRKGLLWGLAVWIKPHVVIPAFFTLALPAPGEQWRAYLAVRAQVFFGGVIAGVVGMTWMVQSGAWPYFVEVFTEWNPDYLKTTMEQLIERANYTLAWFPFWSLGHVLTLPTSIYLVVKHVRSLDRTKTFPVVSLVVLYLGWLAQAVGVQRGLDYVHIPTIILMLSVCASVRVAYGLIMLAWLSVVGAGFHYDADLMKKYQIPNPIFYWELPRWMNPTVLGRWPDAVVGPTTPELMDALATYDYNAMARFSELEQVAEFLRHVDPPLKDGELLAFHDSPHPIYRMLDVKPASRFMHFGTALDMRSQVERIGYEVRRAMPRFVVSDVKRMGYFYRDCRALAPDGDPLGYPSWFPNSQRAVFPWNQPVRFRAGRYYLHEITSPIGPIDLIGVRELEAEIAKQ